MAVAAIQTNRKYILIEKEEKYIEIINNRIDEQLNPVVKVKEIKIKKSKTPKLLNPDLFEQEV